MLSLAAILVFLALQCRANGPKPPAQKDFDEQKYLGKWYGWGAASDCEAFIKMKPGMTLPVMMHYEKNGQMVVAVSFHTPDGCRQMDAEYHKEADGIYTYSSDLGKNEVIMAASDYTTYQMEYMTTEKDGKSCTTIKIGGRTPGMPKDKEGQFDEHIQKMGLKPENSVKFRDTSEGPCVPKTN